MTSKSIENLPQDIYSLMEKGAHDPEKAQEITTDFGKVLSGILLQRMLPRSGASYLRPSNIGEKCERKLWYSINHPDLAEKLTGQTLLKFLLGDIWEAVLLALAELSGHTVDGKQKAATIGEVSGSMDAIIDGVVVDVKSAAPYSFQKFRQGLTPETDAFSYLSQLGFYLAASTDDPAVKNKGQAAFLVGDKTLGGLCLDLHTFETSPEDYQEIIRSKQKMLQSKTTPPRGFYAIPDGKKGNMKLPVHCSYCAFKKTCYPNLRTFLYSSGPRYLVSVQNTPDVTEVGVQS